MPSDPPVTLLPYALKHLLQCKQTTLKSFQWITLTVLPKLLLKSRTSLIIKASLSRHKNIAMYSPQSRTVPQSQWLVLAGAHQQRTFTQPPRHAHCVPRRAALPWSDPLLSATTSHCQMSLLCCHHLLHCASSITHLDMLCTHYLIRNSASVCMIFLICLEIITAYPRPIMFHYESEQSLIQQQELLVFPRACFTDLFLGNLSIKSSNAYYCYYSFTTV